MNNVDNGIARGRPTGIVNILLHGLFFFERKQEDGYDYLEITAPDIPDHNFIGGTRGNLRYLNYQTIDWTEFDLIGGSPHPPRYPDMTVPGDVPLSIAQFSRKRTEVGNLRPGCSKGKLVLPWPAYFYTRRFGPAIDYISRNGHDINSVAKNIKDWSHRSGNVMFGTIAGLTYQYHWNLPTLPAWIPNINYHFYFQPPFIHKCINDVNLDLVAASIIFDEPDNFDVKIPGRLGSGATRPIPLGRGEPITGIAEEDELALGEAITLAPNIDLKKLEEIASSLNLIEQLPQLLDPGAHDFDDIKKSYSSVKSKGSDHDILLNIAMAMIATANCPQFFVG